MAEEYAGRVVRCRQCGTEQAVPGAAGPPLIVNQPAGSPRTGGEATGYFYRTVQIPPVIEAEPGASVWQMAAYLERVVNAQARQGWEFFRTDPIGISVPPGCLGALLGQQTTTVQYHVITFRRLENRSDESVHKSISTTTEASPEKQRLLAQELAEREEKARREAAEKEAAEQRAWRKAIANEESLARREAAQRRRVERDKAYKSRGIEPGPMAWFRALSDTNQAILLGLGIAVPVVALVALIFRAM